MPKKISRRVGKERSKSDTLKKIKPSFAKEIPKMKTLDERHFEKDVVEWMTKEYRLQVMIYYLHLKKNYATIILYMIFN